MTICLYCGAPASDEAIDPMDSSDGTVMLTKWRCRADFTHWWMGLTVEAIARGTTLDQDAGRRAA